MPRLAALGFPGARGGMLDLCADAMAFFFVFDDQFDGVLGWDPARAAAACQRMTDIVHGALPGPGADACSVAFADIWARSTEGAHPGWVARVAHEWELLLRGPGPRSGGPPPRRPGRHGDLPAGPAGDRRHRPAALPR
ncbi:terpene synthase family protein [Streptomyces virginiae]|uniref:terpene synthase family protein n=1 Tax=Streptomyces virginiae TaxID=1961 RepID=UPI00362658A2